MNASELEERLAEEGCSLHNYCIGSRGSVSDAYCLAQVDGRWRVFYTERGLDDDPIFETDNEDEACQYYFRQIMAIRHEHLVGFFRSLETAQGLCTRLEQHAIDTRLDKIPYGGMDDPRYRVFVTGKAIFKTKEILGDVPIEDV